MLGKLGYVANGTRLHLSLDFACRSQKRGEKKDQNSAKSLNSAVTYAQNANLGFKFPKLSTETTTIREYSDAGFANNNELKSQLGMIILLVDKYHNASILHYASRKSRRVVRSILAAELYAFV